MERQAYVGKVGTIGDGIGAAIWDGLFPENVNRTDIQFCFALTPRAFSTTYDQYYVTDDPEDPAYYSTCYIQNNANVFPGYTINTNKQYVPWRTNDHCLVRIFFEF